MAIGAVSGTKIYIGTSEVIASPDDYIEIGNVSNLGNVMIQFSKIAVEQVGSGYTKQIKGTQSAQPFDLTVNRDDADLGQIAVQAAASDLNATYNFQIVENDATASNTPTRKMFKGRVYTKGSQYGGVNDLKKLTISIEIEPDTIVDVPIALF